MRMWPSATTQTRTRSEQIAAHLDRVGDRQRDLAPELLGAAISASSDRAGLLLDVHAHAVVPCSPLRRAATASRIARATSAFDARGTWRSPAAVTIVTSLSDASKPMSAPRDVVDHDRVEALARELVAPVGHGAVAVLGGEADERSARRGAMAARPDEDVRRALERDDELRRARPS